MDSVIVGVIKHVFKTFNFMYIRTIRRKKTHEVNISVAERCHLIMHNCASIHKKGIERFVSISGESAKKEQIDWLSSDFDSKKAVLETLKPFHCTKCPAKFLENSELKAHFSQEHGNEMPFSCQLCGKGYTSRGGLNHHMSLHEGKLFQCPICDRKMTQKGVINRHLRNVHKSAQCSRCMQLFHLDIFHQHVLTCDFQDAKPLF